MENSAVVPTSNMNSAPYLPTELWLQIYGHVIDARTTAEDRKFREYLGSAKIDNRIYNAAMDVFLDNFELEVHFEIKLGGHSGRMPIPMDPVVDSDLFGKSIKITHNTHEFWNSTFARAKNVMISAEWAKEPSRLWMVLTLLSSRMGRFIELMGNVKKISVDDGHKCKLHKEGYRQEMRKALEKAIKNQEEGYGKIKLEIGDHVEKQAEERSNKALMALLSSGSREVHEGPMNSMGHKVQLGRSRGNGIVFGRR